MKGIEYENKFMPQLRGPLRPHLEWCVVFFCLRNNNALEAA